MHTAILTAYADAFRRCYPTYNVEFTRAKKSPDGASRYNVVMNGDAGNRPLTLTEIQEATIDFQR